MPLGPRVRHVSGSWRCPGQSAFNFAAGVGGVPGVNMAGIIQHAIRGSALERLTPWQQAGAVLCLVPAGYANLNGPLPTADTAVMQIWAVKHRNLGHLIRTWGGGTLMGLGYIRWGGITIGPQAVSCSR
jgi:hypothetical protein